MCRPPGLALDLRLLYPIGRLPYEHSVVQLHHRLQVPQEQEGSHVHLKANEVAREFRQCQHLHAIDRVGIVARNIPPVHSGIDRYLNSAASSRRMLQQVNCSPSPLAGNMFRGRLAQDDFHHAFL